MLRKYRRSMGLKQQDVAKLLGIKSSSRISRWEKGEGIPNLVNAVKLAILYRSMVDSLFVDLYRSLREEMRETQEKFWASKKQ